MAAIRLLTVAVLLVLVTEVSVRLFDGGNGTAVAFNGQVTTNPVPGAAVDDRVAARLVGGVESASGCEEWDPEYGCAGGFGETNCPSTFASLTDLEQCLACDYSDHKSSATADCADTIETTPGHTEEEDEEAEGLLGCNAGYTTAVVACVRASGP